MLPTGIERQTGGAVMREWCGPGTSFYYSRASPQNGAQLKSLKITEVHYYIKMVVL